MDKFLYIVSFVAAIGLIVASYLIPNSAPMWLASTSQEMNIMRVIFAVMMLALAFTKPPRAVWMRLVLGSVGAVLGIITLSTAMSGSVHIVDMLLFAEGAVCFLLAAMEAKPARLKKTIERLPRPAPIGIPTTAGWAAGVRSSTTAVVFTNLLVLGSLLFARVRRYVAEVASSWLKQARISAG